MGDKCRCHTGIDQEGKWAVGLGVVEEHNGPRRNRHCSRVFHRRLGSFLCIFFRRGRGMNPSRSDLKRLTNTCSHRKCKADFYGICMMSFK